jgi:hypothetical protein
LGLPVACDDDGITSFNRVRYRRHDESIFLYAFDLIELTATICGVIRWNSEDSGQLWLKHSI